MPGGPQPNGETGISGPVTGTIDNQSFTTVEALATANAGEYVISLSGASDTPSIVFTIEDTPKTYTVGYTTAESLGVIAYTGGFSFILFDSGTVTISSIDTTANEIVGTFNNVRTTDGESSLTGIFTAEIQ